jgi:hypothetical protein
MSRGWKATLAVASGALLVAFALLFPRGESVPPSSSQRTDPVAAERGALESEARARVARSSARAAAEHAAREDPQHERGPRRRDRRRVDWLRVELVPLAQRFFSAFARYELGGSDEKVAATLRATTAHAFGRELAAASPRMVAARPRELARLGRLELVPGVVDRRRIVTADLVGLVRRGARSGQIAIELRMTRRDWRVAGLGQ